VRTKAFPGATLPPKFQFYYRDSTDDIICIANDEELQDCLADEGEGETVRLVVAVNTDMAHEQLEMLPQVSTINANSRVTTTSHALHREHHVSKPNAGP